MWLSEIERVIARRGACMNERPPTESARLATGWGRGWEGCPVRGCARWSYFTIPPVRLITAIGFWLSADAGKTASGRRRLHGRPC